MIDPDRREIGMPGVCTVCGCTDDRACVGPGGEPCSWVPGTGHRLCSACEDPDDDEPPVSGWHLGALLGLGLVALGVAGMAAWEWWRGSGG